ncbi:MAG: hypothetical protein ACOYOV_06390 [Bacteroidales bacterium]
MWTEIFKERIRKQKVEQKKIAQIMGVSETSFYTGILNNSMKFQNVLKVYTYFDWDMNELKGTNNDKVIESNSNENTEKKTEEKLSLQIEDLKDSYEAHIKSLQGQLEFLQDIIKKDRGIKGEVISNAG